MRMTTLLVSAAYSLSMCGCSALTGQSPFSVAAEPLCEETPGFALGPGGVCQPVTPSYAVTPGARKNYIGLVVNESEHFCAKFVNGLVLAETGTNTALDALTTVFTALGTAFTPIATVHALTAAGSISSGWKTAIDSDIYAKATIANYAQAIQSTYYSDLQTYLDALSGMQEADIVPSIEVAKIRSIHKECSLASAQAAVAASLKPGASSQGPPKGTANWAALNEAPATRAPRSGASTSSVVPGHAVQ